MLAFLLVTIVGIPVALLRGLVLSDLIGWFTPFTVPVVQAIGLTYIAACFTSGLKRDDDHAESPAVRVAHILLTSTSVSLTLWFFGWLWHFFL